MFRSMQLKKSVFFSVFNPSDFVLVFSYHYFVCLSVFVLFCFSSKIKRIRAVEQSLCRSPLETLTGNANTQCSSSILYGHLKTEKWD